MPVIIFEGGKLDRAQKADLVRGFTDVAQRVTGIPREAFVVILKENAHENIGTGGTLLDERLRSQPTIA